MKKFKKTYSLKPMISSGNEYHIVYILEHKLSKCFYIGVHSSSKIDILTEYTSSSLFVNKIIEIEGINSFRVMRCAYAKTRKIANDLERKLIVANFMNNYNLNMAYQVKDKVVKKQDITELYHGVYHHKCKIHSLCTESTIDLGLLFQPFNNGIVFKPKQSQVGEIKRASHSVVKPTRYNPFTC